MSAERARLADELHEAVSTRLARGEVTRADGTPFDAELLRRIGERLSVPPEPDLELAMADMKALRIELLEIQRARLDELSHEGSYSTESLRLTLSQLDAEQISLQLHDEE